MSHHACWCVVSVSSSRSFARSARLRPCSTPTNVHEIANTGWHLYCLRPPLEAIPAGDWLCPDCLADADSAHSSPRSGPCSPMPATRRPCSRTACGMDSSPTLMRASDAARPFAHTASGMVSSPSSGPASPVKPSRLAASTV